jgi:hypothetical protein
MSDNKPIEPIPVDCSLKLRGVKISPRGWEIFLGEPLSDYMARGLTNAIAREQYYSTPNIMRLTFSGRM